jgi:hypothetical protein
VVTSWSIFPIISSLWLSKLSSCLQHRSTPVRNASESLLSSRSGLFIRRQMPLHLQFRSAVGDLSASNAVATPGREPFTCRGFAASWAQAQWDIGQGTREDRAPDYFCAMCCPRWTRDPPATNAADASSSLCPHAAPVVTQRTPHALGNLFVPSAVCVARYSLERLVPSFIPVNPS